MLPGITKTSDLSMPYASMMRTTVSSTRYVSAPQLCSRTATATAKSSSSSGLVTAVFPLAVEIFLFENSDLFVFFAFFMFLSFRREDEGFGTGLPHFARGVEVFRI